MIDECAQAISVANHYFTMADDMIPGLENYFADDVVLIWFGRKIKRKENVANFLLSNEIKSFHSFSNITPISDITCDEQSDEEEEQSSDQSNDSPEVKLDTHTSNCSAEALWQKYLHKSEISMTCKNATDSNRKQESDNRNTSIEKHCDIDTFDIEKYIERIINELKIYYDCTYVDTNQNQVSANAVAETNDQSYDLNEYDLRNLFEPEITSQAFVQNVHVHNINRIKLEEEMEPTIKAINRERSQGDESEANTIKYLEANGKIKFVQKYASEDSFLCYHWSRISKQKSWTQKCKLQIAYSLLTDNKLQTIVEKTTEKSCVTQKETHPVCEPNFHIATHSAPDTPKSNRLPSLEEVMQIAFNTDTPSIPDKDYFNGYLRPMNFTKDCEEFLKSFEAEMELRSSVKYVGNKLVFNYPSKKSFNVIYQIHTIIYK